MIFLQSKKPSSLLCTFLLLTLAFANNANSELTSGDKLPDALKNIKSVGGACLRDDMSSSLEASAGRFPVSPDLGCAISASEIRAQISDPNWLLIDMRSATEHEAFHIQNSLSLDLAALQSKPYWRDKSLVLIGGGKLDQELYASCVRLRKLGYKQVRVLSGGMVLWLAQNQAVVGSPTSPQQLARLSDAEFWQESLGANTLIALSKERSALQADLPLSIVLAQTSGETLRAAVERRRKAGRIPKLMSVVLVADSTVTDEQIRSFQLAILPETLLVYTGESEAYKRQLAIQKAVWTAQARGPKQPRCGL
ncbi:MAG: rhodanese-like domain-containing protein [Rhodocyclaceae bacterium]|nr:rhodanese-like domain-containing protein [Rhodocyclaceae bacterium]